MNKNRNPHLSKEEIENYLQDYYGASNVLWLGDGIVGDDTDGHIDNIARFVAEDTIVTMVEGDSADENHAPFQKNLELLKALTTEDGRPFTIIEIRMPKPVYYEDQRLPASYANFYISNKYVIVPMFNDPNDEKAISTLQDCFPIQKSSRAQFH